MHQTSMLVYKLLCFHFRPQRSKEYSHICLYYLGLFQIRELVLVDWCGHVWHMRKCQLHLCQHSYVPRPKTFHDTQQKHYERWAFSFPAHLLPISLIWLYWYLFWFAISYTYLHHTSLHLDVPNSLLLTQLTFILY